ncbi:uncharacterized protein LOC9630411 [Selaginella moellendorffii]|uniref:uncharacterized protein LOC9630411 n=1 Tax=Selaginella moellendorffii TaxID=88036 RepID=UPI000D1D0A65|nr:uncharacterized protein LOC9630411 [Selaginella moellendorffii]|eukprot:XP_002975587.2 uncharacterized protein LOC9630411 [Selaginella moellendorffii]
MGRAGNAGEQQPRITLGSYLDMSRSLNMDPSWSSRQHSNARGRWDMTKSLNVESGFFAKASSRPSRKAARNGNGSSGSGSSGSGSRVAAAKSSEDCVVVAANSPIIDQEHRRSSAAAKSPLSATDGGMFPSRASFHAGLNGKMLPTSPNIRDPCQEKDLIDAFVDQLRTIAASSSNSEPNATTRRVVRRALEFSSNLNAQRITTTATATTGSEIHSKNKVPSSRGVDDLRDGGDDLGRRIYRSKLKGNGGDLRRQHFLPVVVEEKQTVISSPICHSSSSRMKLKSVDMPPAIQQHAVECAFQLLKNMDCKLNCKLIAWQLKKEFDKIHGPAWHCIVGTSFGSYVTHSVGGFIYFAVGKVSILLFRTAIEVVDKK